MLVTLVGVLAVQLWVGQAGMAPPPLQGPLLPAEGGAATTRAPAPAAPGSAAAPAVPAGTPGPSGADAATRPYKGVVVPGPDGKNPLPTPKPDPTKLVWTGFRMVGDKSEVFLQTSREVTFDLKSKASHKGRGGALSVFLRNCRIHLRNNRRNLDTRFFATPVAGVKVRQSRHDVELVISLKEDARPEPRAESGPDGTHFVVLSFPAGKADASSKLAHKSKDPDAAAADNTAAVAPPSLR